MSVKSDMQTSERSTGIPNASSLGRIQLPAPKTFFNRQWWWTTLLVLAGMALLIRLGFWQLDRLEQRRAYNADVVAKLALAPISLSDEPLPADTDGLKHRQAHARGAYDFTQQVALTQQHWMNTPGFHLITPLVIEDGARPAGQRPRVVLVDRGWLPVADLDPENWPRYDVAGPLSVTGYIKLSQTLPKADQALPNAPQTQWYRVDVDAIAAQMPYELLPIYLQQAPSAEGSDELPFREELAPDLSEGPHLSYAIQWFIFTAILAVGYVFFVGKRTQGSVSGIG